MNAMIPSKIPHRLLILAVVLTATFALVSRLRPDSASLGTRTATPESNDSSTARAPTSPPAPETAVRRLAADSGSSAVDVALARFGCVANDAFDKCRFERDPLEASGPKEALWLTRHGYPSRADLERYPTMSDAELDELAKKDRAFAILRARREIEQGQLGGLTELMYLARAGNLYALYEMSRAYHDVESIADFYDAAAYLRVAYLLGDRRAATELYARFPDWAVPSSLALIDARAARLRARMFPGMPADLRPYED